MRNLSQRPFDQSRVSLSPKPTRVYIAVSPPFQVSNETAPVRHVLICDDHPATIRLLQELCAAKQRNNKMAIGAVGAVLLVLLVAAMLWPLL